MGRHQLISNFLIFAVLELNYFVERCLALTRLILQLKPPSPEIPGCPFCHWTITLMPLELLKSFEVDSSRTPLSSQVKSSLMWSSRRRSTWGRFSLKSGHVSVPQRLAGLYDVIRSRDVISHITIGLSTENSPYVLNITDVITPGSCRHATQETVMLKDCLIVTRTLGEEAF